jgi:hypothetical protein
MELKNIEIIIMNLENFGENFMIFGWRGLLKSIGERKSNQSKSWDLIKGFKGAIWSKESSWVQSGDDKQKALVRALKRIQVKRRKYRGELGALVLSLINPDMWGRFTSTKSTQNPATPHFLFFHLHSGPTC